MISHDKKVRLDNKKIFCASIVVVLSAMIISLAFNRSIWLDEGFSLRWSMLPGMEFWERMQLDVCPLYLIMLRIVQTLTGEALWASKLFSALALILNFVIAFVFIRKRFGNGAMLFYCLFMTSIPTIMERAVEVRMYSWAYLWVTLGCVQMYFLLNDNASKKNWVLFLLCSLAASYTHYFAIFTMAVIYIGLFVFYLVKKDKKQIRNWFICFGVTVAGYLPWVPVVLRQSNSSTTSWIQNANSFVDMLESIFYSGIPRMDKYCILLLVVFLVLSVVLLVRHKSVELYWSLTCILAVWAVLAFGIVFQYISRPILSGKYLTIPLCITLFGMASLCKYINKYIVAVMCVLFVFFTGFVYKGTFDKEYGTKVEETFAFAEEHFAEDDIIVSDAGSLSSVIPYYFPNRNVVTDVYNDEYEYLWYFDVDNELDIAELQRQGIEYMDYGVYGFDVEFRIYYLCP